VPAVADSFDRLGQVLVTAENTAAAIELCGLLAEKIRITTVADRS
jgi:hypothetical protein